jgi:hypothetical protein
MGRGDFPIATEIHLAVLKFTGPGRVVPARPIVIAAKAGTQLPQFSHHAANGESWAPAFAGVTISVKSGRGPSIR